MTDQFISELLVLFLLAITCVRIFFQEHVKTDAIAAVPIVALIISVIILFTFGFSFFTMAILVLSFFVFIWNIRAFLRLKENLVIDHYGPWFIFVSVLNLILILAIFVSLLLFRPVFTSARKSNVAESVTRYEGSFSKGFEQITKPFHLSSAKVWKYEYSPLDKDNYEKNSFNSTVDEKTSNVDKADKNKCTILFISDVCSTPKTYKPFLIKLAQNGYTVYAVDFYSKDMPWFGNSFDKYYIRCFACAMQKLFNSEEYEKVISSNEFKYAKEYEAFVKMINPSAEDTVVLVGENSAKKSFEIVSKKMSGLVDYSISLGDAEGYTTKGWGPVEQTNPLLAKKLGYNRDSSSYMSAHLANYVKDSVEQYLAIQKNFLQQSEIQHLVQKDVVQQNAVQQNKVEEKK